MLFSRSLDRIVPFLRHPIRFRCVCTRIWQPNSSPTQQCINRSSRSVESFRRCIRWNISTGLLDQAVEIIMPGKTRMVRQKSRSMVRSTLRTSRWTSTNARSDHRNTTLHAFVHETVSDQQPWYSRRRTASDPQLSPHDPWSALHSLRSWAINHLSVLGWKPHWRVGHVCQSDVWASENDGPRLWSSTGSKVRSNRSLVLECSPPSSNNLERYSNC